MSAAAAERATLATEREAAAQRHEAERATLQVRADTMKDEIGEGSQV